VTGMGSPPGARMPVQGIAVHFPLEHVAPFAAQAWPQRPQFVASAFVLTHCDSEPVPHAVSPLLQAVLPTLLRPPLLANVPPVARPPVLLAPPLLANVPPVARPPVLLAPPLRANLPPVPPLAPPVPLISDLPPVPLDFTPPVVDVPPAATPEPPVESRFITDPFSSSVRPQAPISKQAANGQRKRALGRGLLDFIVSSRGLAQPWIRIRVSITLGP